MEDRAQEAVNPLDAAAQLIGQTREDDPEEVDEELSEDAADDAEEEVATDEEEGQEDEDDLEIVTLDNKRIEIPKGTPRALVDAVSGMAQDLKADYTSKTQGLAERERQAAQVMTSQIEQARNTYLTNLQQMQAVVSSVAGLKSPQEMAALASTDPAEWVRESQRQQFISQVLGGLQQQSEMERQQAEQQAEQERNRLRSEAWGHLGKAGFDRDKLAGLYTEGAKLPYGFTAEELAATLDHRHVLALKDLVEYHKLKASKPAVAAKVAKAPPVPQTKQHQPQNDKRKAEARQKVSKPGARLRDLAAFIQANRG